MKYTLEMEINAPLEKVIELFDNPEHMKSWQPGLIDFELISENVGEKGAKSRLRYRIGNRELEMIETIIKRELPHEFSGRYETKGVWNEIKNFFIKVNENKRSGKLRMNFGLKVYL